MIKIHDTCTVTVRDLGIHGEGIGTADGFTVFVPGALPGETVTAEITLVKKAYAVGRLTEILTRSPFRTEPRCPVYDACGGCQISHLTYEGQLLAKRQRVVGVVTRLAGYPSDIVRPVTPAASPFGYRNKMAAPVSRNGLGFYRAGSHDIIPVSACAIQEDANNRLLAFASDFVKCHGISVYDEKTKRGSLRHVMGRVGADGGFMAALVTATKELPAEREWISEMRKSLPELVSLCHNVQPKPGNVILGPTLRTLWGKDTLTASLCGLSFEVSAYSFFQVHRAQAEILYETVLRYANLSGGETVIDAYCGTGTISLCLAKQAARVIGIEIVAPAIRNAKENAQKNGITNAEFLVGDAGKLMPKLAREGLRPDVIVLDPVRAGASDSVLTAAAGMAPRHIVYVSCNPATFARDAARLRELGYTLREVTPVDMFPQTTHVECVGVFE